MAARSFERRNRRRMEGIGGRWSSSASGSVASNGTLGLALECSEKRAAPPPPLIRAGTDDAIVNSGVLRVLRGRPSGPYTIPARYSFVVAKREGQWRIVHHHSSQRPWGSVGELGRRSRPFREEIGLRGLFSLFAISLAPLYEGPTIPAIFRLLLLSNHGDSWAPPSAAPS